MKMFRIKYFIFILQIIICFSSVSVVNGTNKAKINSSIPKNIEGFFYSEEGQYLGKKGSKDVIYITDKKTFDAIRRNETLSSGHIYSLTDLANISHSDFIDRVNWTYGEGGGMAAEFYAATIDNLARKEGEYGMYKHMNEGIKGSAKDNKQKYFVDYDGGNTNYSRFIMYRNVIMNNQPIDKALRKDIKYIREATKANIALLSGKIQDMTNGAINKAGGKKAIEYALSHNTSENNVIVVKTINKESRYTSYHIFFELGKRQTPQQSYTLVTMEDFDIVKTELISKS